MRDRTNLASKRPGGSMTAAELAHCLPGFKKSGRMYVGPCVAHDDKNPSMVIYDGHSTVQVRCYAGCCEPADIIAVLKRRGLWGGGHDDRGDHPAAHAARQRLAARVSKEPANVSRETHKRLALRIFDEAEPLHQSELVRDYIIGRNLVLPTGFECARFHASCPRGAERVSAIVVLMEALDSRDPRAIQRIFLHRDPDGRARKQGKPMMLGEAGGAAMKLSPHVETFSDDLSYAPTLHVCEGFETALGLLQNGYSPTWALGSKGGIEKLPTMFGVGELVVCADHDEAGLAAGFKCCRRWAAARRNVRMIHRAELGKDFADE